MPESTLTAKLRNTSDRPWTGKYDGIAYRCDPGEAIYLPENLAKHFIGDWDLEAGVLRDREERRVMMMMPEDKRKRDLKDCIQLELEGTESLTDEPVPEKDKTRNPEMIIPQDTEPEFAELNEPPKRKPKVEA